MDVGCLQFSLQEAFQTKMDSEDIKSELRETVQKGRALTEEEQMKFMILPLTYKGQEKKRECIKDCFEMAKKMGDTKAQMFVLSGMLVFADKVIAEKESKKIREWLKMTKVGQLIEEEKMEAIKEAVKKNEEGFAIKLLKRGDDIETIVPLFDELSIEDIERLAEGIK